MGWGGLSHHANVLGDLESFFSSCSPHAQRRLLPPAARASSAHPAGNLQRRWGPRGQRFRSIPGVPRRGGRPPFALCEIRQVRNSIFSRALGPRRAPRPPLGSDCSADALPGKCRASCPWGGGERPPPRGGLLVQTPRIFSLAPRCPFLWGAIPGGCPVRGCRFGWGRGARGWCARPCTAPGELEKNEKMLPPAPRSGIGPCPPHPGAQSRSLAVRKPKNLLPNGKPASAVPRGAPRSPIPRPRPFRAFARRGGANSCAARAPAVALGKARRSPGVVG